MSIKAILCLLVGITIVGCHTSNNSSTPEKPKVVSTSTIIGDLTQQIGGGEIEHISILKPGNDPHVYEPVPSDTRNMEQADLILYNGYNLEPGLIKLMKASGEKSRKLAVGEKVPPLKMEKKGSTVPDPHVWGNATNGVIMVDTIAQALIEISPEDKELFQQNAAKLKEKLERLHSWIKVQIATIPPEQRKLVTTHDAFQYYADAYGIPVVGTLIGISTEEQPSAQTLKNLATAIKKLQIKAIFAETTINPTLIKTVAEEAGVELSPKELYSDSIGIAGSEADTYVKMLATNTCTIAQALGGKCSAFE